MERFLTVYIAWYVTKINFLPFPIISLRINKLLLLLSLFFGISFRYFDNNPSYFIVSTHRVYSHIGSCSFPFFTFFTPYDSSNATGWEKKQALIFFLCLLHSGFQLCFPIYNTFTVSVTLILFYNLLDKSNEN